MGYLGEFAIQTFLSNLLHYTIKKKQSFYTFVHPLITIMTYAYDYINEKKKKTERREGILLPSCYIYKYIKLYIYVTTMYMRIRTCTSTGPRARCARVTFAGQRFIT